MKKILEILKSFWKRLFKTKYVAPPFNDEEFNELAKTGLVENREFYFQFKPIIPEGITIQHCSMSLPEPGLTMPSNFTMNNCLVTYRTK